MKNITTDNYVHADKVWYTKYETWAIFFLYLLVLGFSVSRHELWGDEIHSWNIAKNSLGLVDLIANTRYEGHPPLWYIILFILSKFTHDPLSIQYLHLCICALTAFIFLFECRLLLSYKCLVLFGYYFLYEYGTLSRNYMPGIFFAFVICIVIAKNFKYKVPVYYCLLFLLSNTHFLAFILACSFHACYIWPLFEVKENRQKLFMHIFLGFIILMPSLYFIFPPANSGLNVGFWFALWNKKHLAMAVQAPLKALSPIPAWWEYYSWNTHALLQAQKSYNFLKYLSPFLSAGLIAVCVFILSQYKQALRFFIINVILTLLFALVFPLNSARYVGFIFIGFIIALWLTNAPLHLDKIRRFAFYLLLIFQLAGAFIAVKKDWQFPFTHANEIKDIAALVPPGNDLVTDYWCLNYASAFLDRPVYCFGFNREKSFLLWDKEMLAVSEQKDMYTEGAKIYFEKSGKQSVYFIVNTPKHDIIERDSLFFKTFNAELVTAEYNAMEKYSDIYLYKLTPKIKK